MYTHHRWTGSRSMWSARPRCRGGGVAGNHADARWMQDHHAAVGVDPRSGVNASDTVRILVGFTP